MKAINKVVLVTGSSSGMGKEIALSFAKQGALVALHGRDEERLLNVSKQIKEIQGTSHIFPYDLSIIGNAEKLYLDVVSTFNKNISILVNSAGLAIHGNIINIPTKKYHEIINVNVVAPIELTKLVLANMHQSEGRIINITSGIGVVGMPGISAYSLTKAAFTAFSESLYFETLGTNIDVVTISPGLVDTPFLKNMEQYGKIKEKFTEGNKISPKHIADILTGQSTRRRKFFDFSRSRLVGILKYCTPSLLRKIIVMKTRD